MDRDLSSFSGSVSAHEVGFSLPAGAKSLNLILALCTRSSLPPPNDFPCRTQEVNPRRMHVDARAAAGSEPHGAAPAPRVRAGARAHEWKPDPKGSHVISHASRHLTSSYRILCRRQRKLESLVRTAAHTPRIAFKREKSVETLAALRETDRRSTEA